MYPDQYKLLNEDGLDWALIRSGAFRLDDRNNPIPGPAPMNFDPKSDTCPDCGEPIFEGVVTAALTPSGHHEINGFYCPACEWYESHDGEHTSEPKAKPMTDTTLQTINVIHSENGIKTVNVVPLNKDGTTARDRRADTVKVSPHLAGVPALDALVLISRDKYAPALGRVVAVNTSCIADDLNHAYAWLVAVIDETTLTRTVTDEKDLRQAIARANAMASARAILDEMPEDIRALAKPQATNNTATDEPATFDELKIQWQPLHTAPENLLVEVKYIDYDMPVVVNAIQRSGVWYINNTTVILKQSITGWRHV